MDKARATIVLQVLERAAKQIAAADGLQAKVRGNFHSSGVKLTVEFEELVASGAGATHTAALLRACATLGIDPDQTFIYSDKTHRLVDYNTRAKRTPFITEAQVHPSVPPKRYRWTASAIKQLIDAQKKPVAPKAPDAGTRVEPHKGSGRQYQSVF